MSSRPKNIFQAALCGDSKAVAERLNEGVEVDVHSPFEYAVQIHYTPLFQAVRRGAIDTAELLIMRGANVNATTEYGTPPIHLAASQEAGDGDAMLRFLLRHKADVNKSNRDCTGTALYYAILEKKTERVKILLEHQADINVRLNSAPHTLLGRVLGTRITPLMKAVAMRQTDISFPQEIVDLLQSKAVDLEAQKSKCLIQ